MTLCLSRLLFFALLGASVIGEHEAHTASVATALAASDPECLAHCRQAHWQGYDTFDVLMHQALEDMHDVAKEVKVPMPGKHAHGRGEFCFLGCSWWSSGIHECDVHCTAHSRRHQVRLPGHLLFPRHSTAVM